MKTRRDGGDNNTNAATDHPDTKDALTSSDLTLEDAFFILKDTRRKLVVDALSDVDEPIELGDLAESIAAQEVGEQPSPQERKRVYIALSQTHLDVLEEYGVVEHREIANIVTRGPEFSAVARVLDTARTATVDDAGER